MGTKLELLGPPNNRASQISKIAEIASSLV